MNDWAAEMMERHGMQRIQQGTAKGSPLLAGNRKRCPAPTFREA